jgi:hypothetical protein
LWEEEPRAEEAQAREEEEVADTAVEAAVAGLAGGEWEEDASNRCKTHTIQVRLGGGTAEGGSEAARAVAGLVAVVTAAAETEETEES